ncbi:MAG: hypothetical protein Q8R98_22535 [Rubrivivax sp.]|nr:hypothetical protein [Rubrivivax sp.]MDP3614629.1 hypothetical protein [Rubrivivax sp.]
MARNPHAHLPGRAAPLRSSLDFHAASHLSHHTQRFNRGRHVFEE